MKRAAAAVSARISTCPSNSVRRGKTISPGSVIASTSSPPRFSRNWFSSSAGFDTHRLDPVGNLGLETEDFIPLTNLVLDVADAYAGGRVVSVLEGGYDPKTLGDCVTVHLAEMLKAHGGGGQEGRTTAPS